MKTVVVIYDTKYGRTEQMARCIYETISKFSLIECHMISTANVSGNWKLISGSDAIIFGSPTFFGSVSASFKQFMDSTSVFFFEQKWKDKFAAGFTCSSEASGDKLTTLIQISIFCAQHGMNWVNLGLGKAGDYADTDNENNLNRLGCWLGAAAQPDKDNGCVNKADLGTCKHLAQRVANIILRCN